MWKKDILMKKITRKNCFRYPKLMSPLNKYYLKKTTIIWFWGQWSRSNEGHYGSFRFCFFCFFSAELVRTITCLCVQIGQLYLVCGCMTIRCCVADRNDLRDTLTFVRRGDIIIIINKRKVNKENVIVFESNVFFLYWITQL
jgi:hypothetical protein